MLIFKTRNTKDNQRKTRKYRGVKLVPKFDYRPLACALIGLLPRNCHAFLIPPTFHAHFFFFFCKPFPLSFVRPRGDGSKVGGGERGKGVSPKRGKGSNGDDDEEYVYELRCVLYHKGSNVHSGHIVAEVRWANASLSLASLLCAVAVWRRGCCVRIQQQY